MAHGVEAQYEDEIILSLSLSQYPVVLGIARETEREFKKSMYWASTYFFSPVTLAILTLRSPHEHYVELLIRSC